MAGSRTLNSVKNIRYGIINKIVTLFLSLVGRYIFLLVLPVEYLGINSVFSDVLTLLSLADLGFVTAMSYSLYKPLAENDTDKIIRLMTFYGKVYHVIAAVVGGVGILLLPFLNYIIVTDYTVEHLHLYYLMALFNTVVSYLFAYKQTLMAADQKYYIISKYSMWIAFAKIIFQTIILYLSKSYTEYLFVGVLTTIAYNLLVKHQAEKYYPYLEKKAYLEGSEKKTVISNMKSIFGYKLSEVIFSGTDNILISMISGTIMVGMYANYNTIVSRLLQFPSIILSSLTASVGNLVAGENNAKGYRIFKTLRLMSSWIAGFIVTCTLWLIDDFIVIWLGDEYLIQMYVLVPMLLNVFYSIMRYSLIHFREATGLYRKMQHIMVVCAVLNIILSVVLGKFLGLGMAGIVAATFIARILSTYWYEPRIIYKEYFKLPVKNYYSDSAMYLMDCIIACAISGIIVFKIPVQGVLMWILKAVITAVVVNLYYLIRYRKTEEFRLAADKILNLRRNKCTKIVQNLTT